MRKDLSSVSPSPRIGFSTQVSFYGDDAESISELADLNGLSKSEVIRRLVIIGLNEVNSPEL